MRPNLTRSILSARIFMPWNNLGCLGFRHGQFYMDAFAVPYWGVFIVKGGTRTYYRLGPPQAGWWRLSALRTVLQHLPSLWAEEYCGYWHMEEHRPLTRLEAARLALRGVCRIVCEALVCDWLGHNMVGTGWAGPDSGGDGAQCTRCGYSWHHTYY